MARVVFFALIWIISLSCSKLIQEGELLDTLKSLSTLTILLRSNEDIDNEYLQFFLTQNETPVVISTFADSDKAELDVDAVFLTDTAHMNDTMSTYAMVQRVFFVIITDEELDKAWVVEILYDLWIRKCIYKVHILSHSGIFVFDQFHYPYGFNKPGELVPIAEKGVFPMFRDMNRFPMRVLIFNTLLSKVSYDAESDRVLLAESPDVNMALLLEQKLNFKMSLINPTGIHYGQIQLNGTFTGGLGLIVREEADILLTGYFVKDYYTEDIEFSVAVDMDKLCCYVQKAQRIPQSILPIMAVSKFMWGAYFGMVTMSMLIWLALRLGNRWRTQTAWREYLKSDLFQIIIDTWMVSFRVDILHVPSFYSERILMLCLSGVSIVFVSLFESSISTAYMMPFHYKDLTDLNELNESGTIIYYRYHDFKTNTLDKAGLYNSEFLNDFGTLETELVIKHSGYGGLIRLHNMMPNKVQALHKGKIHVVSECLEIYRIGYILHRRSPYTYQVNRVMLHTMEAGLFAQWIKEAHFKNALDVLNEPNLDGVYMTRSLTIKNLQFCFHVLVVGYLLSVAVFLFEMFFLRLRIAWRGFEQK